MGYIDSVHTDLMVGDLGFRVQAEASNNSIDKLFVFIIFNGIGACGIAHGLGGFLCTVLLGV